MGDLGLEDIKNQLWQFWVDRGGTFTDIVGYDPDGNIYTHKLLSENRAHYQDAAIEGVSYLLQRHGAQGQDISQIGQIKMGTTVATNALLEREGEPTLLVITKGFKDALRIGYQSRPHLFALNVELPQMLYQQVIEAHERVSANGEVVTPLDELSLRAKLMVCYQDGIKAIAIVLMHGYRYPQHEKKVAELAHEIGFTQVSVSHEVSPLMKLVSRGDTTVVDAYLTPILHRYINQVAKRVSRSRLVFMQSNGGLIQPDFFQGKDAILSGPAGGVVGMVKTAQLAGFNKLIGFDMGGTSTDVSHFNGEYERTYESVVAGVRLRAPMMMIHTVAAGGGSILQFDGSRFRVGPESAGADPGPACYRNQGPLTVTDCNVMLGILDPQLFPKVFGPSGKESLDQEIVEDKFNRLAGEIFGSIGNRRTPVEVADGFLSIAIENMANAIKKISIQRGYDVSEYTLCCFGGAGGQHTCRVADALSIKKIYLHPLAGVLSAYGMGLADTRLFREQAIEDRLILSSIEKLNTVLKQLKDSGTAEMRQQGFVKESIESLYKVHIRYHGSDTPLVVDFADHTKMVRSFEKAHQRQYGFIDPKKSLIVEAVHVELVGKGENLVINLVDEEPTDQLCAVACKDVWFSGQWLPTPFYKRNEIPAGQAIAGPAIIVESTGTIVIEPGWQGLMRPSRDIVLTRVKPLSRELAIGTLVDPVMLEIFNNLFMSIAEQMGTVLENTSVSVNIKERLDFSCAIFDDQGELVANAPHMPVHLGSMSESIKAVIHKHQAIMRPGDAYILNAPYNGGTHLPDITVVKPVFVREHRAASFYVASRGHHADIGGITPGSMPPDSRSVEEEGVLFDNIPLVVSGRFMETEIRTLLNSGPFPARNADQNIADLRAQIAACEKGVQELERIVTHYGLDVVLAYMHHVQDNAQESVQRVLDVINEGSFRYEMDDSSVIAVKITIDRIKREASIDFTGTSSQHPGNYNAPKSVCIAAVLYVFRCLVDDDIPLNAGCLKPLNIIIPEKSMINPEYPAAVVAGNVETSQYIVDALLGALGVAAASQGTMNNFTWGNEHHQYYETLCGGSGATPYGAGTDAVHTHMTNSRLTDPEVLEWRFPVRLEQFCIRTGSGGKGKFSGGDGVIRKVRFLEKMNANILAGHRRVAPYGIRGGEAGATGCNYVEHPDGSVSELAASDKIMVKPGDVFVIETPGGGGCGSPESDRPEGAQIKKE